jgi:MobA/MobL family
MATFYVRTTTGKASKGTGGKHADYIAGLGKYADKDEVKSVVDKNMPDWAKDGKDFFSKADELERANGRSFRSLVIAIPTEAKQNGGLEKWAQGFADDLLKDKHAYRLAIHDKGDGNPHAHLMFCERGRDPEKNKDDPKSYFVRSNKKLLPNSKAESSKWLADAKKMYLSHVQTVAPDYKWTKEKATGAVKVGPKLKHASPKQEEGRKGRERLNLEVAYVKHGLGILDKQEAALNAPKPAPAPVQSPTSQPNINLASKTGAQTFTPPSPPPSVGGASKSKFEGFVVGAVTHARVHTHAHAIAHPPAIATMRARVALDQVKTNQKQGGAGGGKDAFGAAMQQVIREQEKQNAKSAVQAAQRADKDQREMKQTAHAQDSWVNQTKAQAKAEEQRAQQIAQISQQSTALARAFVVSERDPAPVAAVLSDETKRAQFVAEQRAWQNAYNKAPAAGLNEQMRARADAALTIAEQLAIERKQGPSPSQAPRPAPRMAPRMG